jgi:hypothetical protein
MNTKIRSSKMIKTFLLYPLYTTLLLVIVLLPNLVVVEATEVADPDLTWAWSQQSHRSLNEIHKIAENDILQTKVMADQQHHRHLAQCSNMDWTNSCPSLIARRRRHRHLEEDEFPNLQRFSGDEFEQVVGNLTSSRFSFLPSQLFLPSRQQLFSGERPTMVYDANCLQRHRFDIQLDRKTIGSIAYYATTPLQSGDGINLADSSKFKQAIVIHHGSARDADVHYCLMQQLVYDTQQKYSHNASAVLVIAPNFNYKTDDDVYVSDAYFNTTKVR